MMERRLRPKQDESKKKLLVVDDEESLRHYLRLLLSREGYDVETAENASEAWKLLQEKPFSIVLSDVRMPGEKDGLQLLEECQRRGNSAAFVMMSAYGSRDLAMKAIRLGAFDYVEKPIQKDDLLFTLQKFLERERLHQENRQLKAVLRSVQTEEEMVASSPAMKQLLTVAQRVASFPSTVLIQGESGTGKELLARAIHRWSERAQGPFVAVNCGSIPDNLLESEFFGYSKGAFTGAIRDHTGLLESASGGTLFLDEVGELPLALQVKLLRVLQESCLRRIGETHLRKIDARILAASNRDLVREVEAGRFRQDLFYRLHVVTLTLLPLSQRLEDIPPLLSHYLDHFNAQFGTSLQGISPEAMRCLLAYPWPGNVRELRNVVERAVVLEEGPALSLHSLPSEIQQAQRPSPVLPSPHDLSLKKALREVEQRYIVHALEKTQGNRTAAAKLLEISHRTLLYKLKEYSIS